MPLVLARERLRMWILKWCRYASINYRRERLARSLGTRRGEMSCLSHWDHSSMWELSFYLYVSSLLSSLTPAPTGIPHIPSFSIYTPITHRQPRLVDTPSLCLFRNKMNRKCVFCANWATLELPEFHCNYTVSITYITSNPRRCMYAPRIFVGPFACL